MFIDEEEPVVTEVSRDDYIEDFEKESFLGAEEEEADQNDDQIPRKEEDYENDSFIIEDNGGTNDRDFTSSTPQSEGEYSSEDEVSNRA